MPRHAPARALRRAHLTGPLVIAVLLALAVFAVLRVELVSAQTFTPGSQARVAADGDSLRLRAGATVSAAVIASIPDRSIVTIREGTPVSADGYTWQYIEWNGAIGYVAALYLEPLGTSGSPTATPSTTATATPTTTPGGAALGTITGSLPPAGKAGMIAWGGGSMDSLAATASAQGCNLRSVYTVRNGLFVAYTPGGPSFINASWVSQVGELTGVSALLVFCDSTSDTAAPPPSGSGAAPSSSGPPGPGGNE